MRADLRRPQQGHILGFPLLQYSRSRERSFLGPSDHAFELALEFGLFPVNTIKSCLISCITDIFKEKACKDRICPLPAIELGLLQRNVSIRVTLAFLLNVPFSLLQWTERFSRGPSDVHFKCWYIYKMFCEEISSLLLTLDLYSFPNSGRAPRGLWIPMPPAEKFNNT